MFGLLFTILPTTVWCGDFGGASIVDPHLYERASFFPFYLQYSAQAGRELIGAPTDESGMERELARLSDRLRPLLSNATTGKQVVDAFYRVLFKEEGYSYDGLSGDPENFLLGPVLTRKRGNCLGLSMLYLALAERLSVPFRGACVPSHCFVRYEWKGDVRNVEFASRGEDWREERYRREFRIGPARPYLRSLGGGEMLGVFLKSLGAAYSKQGREEHALRLYDEAVRRFPGMPEAYFNAGVSLQRMGRYDEATARYRGALSLDPELAPARDNLGIVLAMRGNFAEAIAEGRRAVALEPRNAAMRGNLAFTYYAAGHIDEGIREFRRALEIAPGYSRARAGLAMSYSALGRDTAKGLVTEPSPDIRTGPSMPDVSERHGIPPPAES